MALALQHSEAIRLVKDKSNGLSAMMFSKRIKNIIFQEICRRVIVRLNMETVVIQ